MPEENQEREKGKEIPRNTYIEIVHADRDLVVDWRDFNGDPGDVSKAITTLIKEGYELHYFPKGDPKRNLPKVPKDTPIVLGGAILEECVRIRGEAYRRAGFVDVRVEGDLSLKAAYNPKNRARRCIT